MIAVHHRMTTENYAARMLLQIHDELVFEVTRSQLAPLKEMLQTEMSLGQPLSVPLVVDISVGDHWGTA